MFTSERNLIDYPPLTGLLFVTKQITRLTHYAFDAVLSMLSCLLNRTSIADYVLSSTVSAFLAGVKRSTGLT